jgi:Na+-driven multidrug efflux pump
MLAVLFRPRNPVSIHGPHGWMPRFDTVRSVFNIGVPSALEELSFAISFAVLTAVIAALGTEALAAQRIAFNALSLAFLPGFGVSLAATALVGQSVGARDARFGSLVTRVAAQYAAIWMGAIGVLYFFAATPIMRAFTDDPQVVSAGAGALRALTLSQPFWGITFVQAGALRGTGNSTFPLVVNSLWIWSTVLICWVAIQQFDAGLTGTWLVFSATVPVPLLLFQRRITRDSHLGKHARLAEMVPLPAPAD